MDEIRSSLGLHQIDKLDKFIKLRKKNFLYLKQKINKISGIEILNTSCEKNIKSSYYSLCVILKNRFKKKRFEIIKQLNKKGIGTSIHYPKIVSDYKYYKKKYNLNRNDFLNASKISYNSFNLPIGPHITKKNLEYIVYTIEKTIIEMKKK